MYLGSANLPVLKSMTKKIVSTVIIGFLATDLILFLVVPRYFATLHRWLFYRSECSLTELLGEVNAEQTASAAAAVPILERTESGLDLWETPRGKWWTAHGDSALRFLTYEQLKDIYELPGHEIRKGDIVLDCGANIGIFTRTALSRGASLVVAIEPSPQTLNALRRNFDAEIREGRVVVYSKGVWDHDAEMELSINEVFQARNTLVLPQGGPVPKVRVPLTTIDKIVAELKLPRVDFIKMDIEGAEKQAIKGAENTIRRFRPRMSLSSEHLEDDFTAIPALVHSIEPNYTYRGCDCIKIQKRIKALVLAFDPIS
jgi:FkbM family methyltransferase